MYLSGGRTLWMFESGWEALLDVWEELGGPLGCPGVVGRPSWRSVSCRETLPEVRKLWEALQMSGSGRENLRDVWQMLGGPPRYPGVVWRPPQKSGSGRDALPDVRE